MDLSPDDPRLARWYYYLALAHFAAGRCERATGWTERALGQNPGESTTADAHLILATSHANLGSANRAAEALIEAVRLWPDLPADLVPLAPYTDAHLRERYVDGLRKAGLEG